MRERGGGVEVANRGARAITRISFLETIDPQFTRNFGD